MYNQVHALFFKVWEVEQFSCWAMLFSYNFTWLSSRQSLAEDKQQVCTWKHHADRSTEYSQSTSHGNKSGFTQGHLQEADKWGNWSKDLGKPPGGDPSPDSLTASREDLGKAEWQEAHIKQGM
jgi:hypothetical protein